MMTRNLPKNRARTRAPERIAEIGYVGLQAERELKPVPGLVFGLAGALATASIVALTAFAAPRPADALPAYATQTKLACGRCHVSAAGGGALTGFGKAFVANGHKVPSKEQSQVKRPLATRRRSLLKLRRGVRAPVSS